MATAGVLGNGVKMGYSASSPTTYTAIGQLMNIDQFMQLVSADIDTTRYSTSNIMTTMPGMIDAPEMSFTLLSDHDPSTSPSHEVLRKLQSGSGDSTAGNNVYFRVEVPVNRQQTSYRGWMFQGFVKTYTPNLPIADKQTTQVTVKFAGSYAVDGAPGATQIT